MEEKQKAFELNFRAVYGWTPHMIDGRYAPEIQARFETWCAGWDAAIHFMSNGPG